MAFGFLWVDMLMVSLLWVAAGAAVGGRISRKWVRYALLPMTLGIPLAALGMFVYAAAMAKYSIQIEPNWFVYAVSLVVAYLVGASLILGAGRRPRVGSLLAAARWKAGLLALGCLVALALGYMTLWNMDLATRAKCAIQSAKAKVLYLATLPAITTDAQNAAPVYEKALAKLWDDAMQKPGGDDAFAGFYSDKFDPNDPALLAYLKRQDSTITMLHQAAALPACRFDEIVTNMDYVALHEMQNKVRIANITLKMHSLVEIARGHTSSAIIDAATLYGMGRHMGQQSDLGSALLGFGTCGMADGVLEAALPQVANRDELASLRSEELPPLRELFQRALWGDEVYGLALIDRMPASDWETLERDVSGAGTTALSIGSGPVRVFRRVFFLDADVYLARMNDYQTWAAQPYYKIRDLLSNPRNGYRPDASSAASFSISRLAFATIAMCEAENACALAGVAMTRYRLDHGAMPSRLDDLVPAYLDEIPTDPFNGQPIKLAIKPDKWIIYSVGPDGIDDGGAEYKLGKGDITFTLRPAGADATTRP